MADWSPINEITNKADEAGLTPHALSTALSELAVSNINNLIKEICHTNKMSDEAFAALGSVYLLAKAAINNDLRHDFLCDLSEFARDLVSAAVFLPEVLYFLQCTVERLVKTTSVVNQRLIAIDALICGINSANPNRETFILTLGLLMPLLKADERDRFIKATQSINEQLLKRYLVQSLKGYHDRLTRVEKSIHKREWIADAFDSVITIHSHKGGVGKTTIAISLALKIASNNRRVCLIDCDEQGPSMHYYLSADRNAQSNVQFFSDWFCSENPDLPEGLIQPVAGFNTQISFIPGSFMGVDISNLDSYQTKSRTKHPEEVRNRLMHLLYVLLHDKGFDSVIVDTSPGLVHLSLDVLMACFNVRGCHVFVMRPRPVDVGQLCIEEDWVVLSPDRDTAEVIVVNGIPQLSDSLTIMDYTNSEMIANELNQWPQFQAYSGRFFTNNIAEVLKKQVEYIWPLFSIVQVDYIKDLMKAETIHYNRNESLYKVLSNDHIIMNKSDEILNKLKKQWMRGRP